MKNRNNSINLKKKALLYLKSLKGISQGEYRNCIGGKTTLYASCFAVMSYHYLNSLKLFNNSEIEGWANYILSFQRKDGTFVGPEITKGNLLSDAHTHEHLSWHLTCHVLPALNILGVKPHYRLSFIYPYLEKKNLLKWLEKRNWDQAWLEGNNLLFMGQLLTYLATEEKLSQAGNNVQTLFQWLDERVDPPTGLWGTAKSVSNHYAAYGGYHQLLLYYYWKKPVSYKKKLVDTILNLQHFDGGFSSSWGGGSCEDVDCVDILVNMYKLVDYRRDEIEKALLKASLAILRRQTPEGGFVYRIGEEFFHMGMEFTYAPKNIANIFSTWFAIHTIALISEVIDIPKYDIIRGEYSFNNICSMGWHRKWNNKIKIPKNKDYIIANLTNIVSVIYFMVREIKRSSKALSKLYEKIK